LPGVLAESRSGAPAAADDAETGIGGSEPRRTHSTPPTPCVGPLVPVAETRIGGTEPRRTHSTPPTPCVGPAAPVTMVIGVGLNLAQRTFPSELADRATSVVIETGRVPDHDAMLETLLEEFDAWRARLETQGFDPVRERWLAWSETIGCRVTVDTVSGVAVGLDVAGGRSGGCARSTSAGRRSAWSRARTRGCRSTWTRRANSGPIATWTPSLRPFSTAPP